MLQRAESCASLNSSVDNRRSPLEVAIAAKVIVAIIWGAIVSLLAKRKNRNPWAWGLCGAAGALTWLIPLLALLVLAFTPYQCPKCKQSLTNKQAKGKICSACGSFDGNGTTSLSHTASEPVI